MSIIVKEVEGKKSELKNTGELVGKASWKTEKYQQMYNEKVGETEVYSAKPWFVKEGDVLHLRPLEDILVLQGKADSEGYYPDSKIPAGCDEEVYNYFLEFCKELTVDKDMLECIENNDPFIKEYEYTAENGEKGYFFLSLPLFMFGEDKVYEEEVEEETYKVYSIKQEDKKEEIINEMISKVDFKRVKNLLSICASTDSKRRIVSSDVTRQYLRMWAEAKYEFYLLFGRNLYVTKEIELAMSSKEMETLKAELINKYPQYGLYIGEVGTEEMLENKMKYLGDYAERYGKQFYKKGMKLSKFFSDFLKDEGFNIALSQAMQSKSITGDIFISIDPYDYLTSSLNKHNWDSCHRITDGCYGMGSLSYMVDKSTLVAYRCNAKQSYKYNYFGIKFEGNSKLHRQLIYFDKNTCSAIFSRQYPNPSQELSKEIRTLLEEIVSGYFGLNEEDSVWINHKDCYSGDFNDTVSYHYSDMKNFSSLVDRYDFHYNFIYLQGIDNSVCSWEIGDKLPCLMGCGGFIRNKGTSIGLCSECDD